MEWGLRTQNPLIVQPAMTTIKPFIDETSQVESKWTGVHVEHKKDPIPQDDPDQGKSDEERALLVRKPANSIVCGLRPR